MNQPSAYTLRKLHVEVRLDEESPEWRERFQGDWRRAEDFYRPTFGRIVNGGGGTQPAETEEIPYRDPDSDFDADLEDAPR